MVRKIRRTRKTQSLLMREPELHRQKREYEVQIAYDPLVPASPLERERPNAQRTEKIQQMRLVAVA